MEGDLLANTGEELPTGSGKVTFGVQDKLLGGETSVQDEGKMELLAWQEGEQG